MIAAKSAPHCPPEKKPSVANFALMRGDYNAVVNQRVSLDIFVAGAFAGAATPT